MGKTMIQDIPGYANVLINAVASVASNAADTVYQIGGIAPFDGFVDEVKWVATADQAGDTANYRTLEIVNLGSDATGTTVVASHALTASIAANTPTELTLAAGSAVNDGDLLAYVTVSTGNGTVVSDAAVQIVIKAADTPT